MGCFPSGSLHAASTCAVVREGRERESDLDVRDLPGARHAPVRARAARTVIRREWVRAPEVGAPLGTVAEVGGKGHQLARLAVLAASPAFAGSRIRFQVPRFVVV